MDRSKIGNTRQQDDNRIAVLDAIDLGECWRELSDALPLTALFETDELTSPANLYRSLGGDPGSPEIQKWIQSCARADEAAEFLRVAIASGDLRVWRVHEAREICLAPIRLDPNNIRYGVFNTFEYPPPDMQGARLWVKCDDWNTFVADHGLERRSDQPISTAKAEHECLEWLISEFSNDAELRRSKRWFQARALAHFNTRLSVRGFNRAWKAVAPQFNRTKPGRKS